MGFGGDFVRVIRSWGARFCRYMHERSLGSGISEVFLVRRMAGGAAMRRALEVWEVWMQTEMILDGF